MTRNGPLGGESGVSYRCSRSLGVLAVLALVVTTVLATGAVEAESAAPVRSLASGSGADDPSFVGGVFQRSRGETVAIPIALQDGAGDTVNLMVGSGNESDFEVRATLRDVDGDGWIVGALDTAAAGDGDPESYLWAAGADAVENRTELASPTSGGLASSDYPLRLGDPADPADVAVLSLTEPWEPDTASYDGAAIDRAAAVEGATARLDVTMSNSSDTATLRIGGAGGQDTAEARLRDIDGDGDVVVDLDTATARNGDPTSYLSARGPDAVLSASQISPVVSGGLIPKRYDLTLRHDGETIATGTLGVYANETALARDATASFSYEGDAITVQAADNQTIRGETSLPPGTEARVRIRPTNESAGWRSDARTEVAPDGSFQATFDLAGKPGNGTFEAVLRTDGVEVATAPGEFTPCETDCLRTDEVRVASTVEVAQNETAEIPVTFDGGDRLNVSVRVGLNGSRYLNATVRDTDGDSRATLLLRTAPPGDEPRLLVANDNETRPATVRDAPGIDGPLPVASYFLTLSQYEENHDPAGGFVVVYEDTPGPAGATPGSAPATETPTSATPDPLQIQAGSDGGGLDFVTLGALGVGAVLAAAGLFRFVRR